MFYYININLFLEEVDIFIFVSICPCLFQKENVDFHLLFFFVPSPVLPTQGDKMKISNTKH